jgi:hypothetical protein
MITKELSVIFSSRLEWITVKSVDNGLSVLMYYLVAVLALASLGVIFQADAQPFPVPPPLPSPTEQEVHVAEGDKTPPSIKILTDKLEAGKNVFRVQITDESSLQVREVRYVQGGQFKTEGLFRDQNDIYKALIDIQPPSRIVLVTVGDAAGNVATAHQEYEVSGRPDIFKGIMDVLRGIPGYIQEFLERF